MYSGGFKNLEMAQYLSEPMKWMPVEDLEI